jgi:hypothetical protein
MVNRSPAEVISAFGYPGATDGYQVNFRLPADIAKGSATIHVSADWISSCASHYLGPIVNEGEVMKSGLRSSVPMVGYSYRARIGPARPVDHVISQKRRSRKFGRITPEKSACRLRRGVSLPRRGLRVTLIRALYEWRVTRSEPLRKAAG